MFARLFILFAFVGSSFSLLSDGVDFEKEILPILQELFIECHQAHNEKNGRIYKPKAGLRMDGLAHLMFGSDDGPVVPNHPSKSSIYTRVVLPADDDDRMPPKGEVLTTLQQDLLDNGSGRGQTLVPGEGNRRMEKLVRNQAAEQAKVPEFVTFFQKLGEGRKPVDQQLITDLRKASGILIRPIGKGSPLLEARVVTRHARVNDEALKKLLPLANLLVRLDIRDTAVTDDVCGSLGKFSSLVELNLRGCKVGDKGVAQLMGLKKLQTLNLGKTEVTKHGVVKLLQLPALTTLNLWQSKAGKDQANFSQARSGLRIIN